MIDIYNRLSSDQNYKRQVETEDEVEMILSQVKMILGTKPGDVLGAPYFGLNIKKYLFNLSYSQEEMTKIIREGILSSIQYDKNRYNVDVSIDFGKDRNNYSDYAVINVTINQIKRLGVLVSQ